MIVSLNLVLSYPVHWERYEILRDFVQNFYDSVGSDRWKEAFQYEYDRTNQTIRMGVNDVTFSYEWLMHIGASTKTSEIGKKCRILWRRIQNRFSVCCQRYGMECSYVLW